MVFIIILYCIIFHRSGTSGSTYHFVLYPLLVLISFLFTSHRYHVVYYMLWCCGASGNSRSCSWNVNV